MVADQSGDGGAGGELELLVRVGEGSAQELGEAAADVGLAGAGEADEGDVAVGGRLAVPDPPRTLTCTCCADAAGTVVAMSPAARNEPTEGVSGRPRGRGRPPAQKGAETREAIIKVAQRLFGARGYRGASMDAVAAECGLNERALYYHFRSKRELFEAVAGVALVRLGSEIADRVFSRTALHDRISAYIEVFRDLHESDPDLLPFIGMLLVDWRLEARPSLERALSGPGEVINGFLGTLVDDALARDELAPGVDRDGALMYLVAIGMGVTLVSGGDNDSFPAMLDVLDRLNEGTLYRSSTPGDRDGRVGGNDVDAG